MFFRRRKDRVPGFEERIEQLKRAGFSVVSEAGGTTLVARGDCVARVTPGSPARIVESGLWTGQEIATLTDLGFQKVFRTPAGREAPALAAELQALHALLEDVREGLGLASLYNLSLGTVNASHAYDCATGRDQGRLRRVPD